MGLSSMAFSLGLLYAGGALFLLLFVLWFSVTVYLYLLHRRYAHIPSPKMPSFYLGHLSIMMNVLNREGPDGEVYMKWYEECGQIFVYFIIHKPFVVTLNPDDLKELIKPRQYKKPRFFYEFLTALFGQRFMGQGLVTVSDYDTWKRKRNTYEHAFRKSYLKGLIPSFNECVDQFLERLRPLADGETQVPMKEEFATLTLSIISKVAFGIDLNQTTWSDEFLGLKHAKGNKLSWLLQHCMTGMMKGAMHPFFKYYGQRSEIESYRETARAIRKIGRECIQKRIKAIEDGEQVPNDILTSALKAAVAEGSVDLEELEDDFTTFYVAGQETTSNVLSFALILLLQHPEVLDRVLTEISDVLGDRKLVTVDDLEQLHYTEQVLLETMRLYQPVGGFIRVSSKDQVLSNYKIPKGTCVMTTTFVACRLSENFEDPLTFNPSNFDPDRKPDPYVYFPFSLGHRSCLGKTFAMMEAKIIIARLLQSFHINLPEGYKLQFVQRSTHTPKDDVPCTLECRSSAM